MSVRNDKEGMSSVGTTGHEWDGIQEFNNPLPRWWLYTFYATIVFAIGYVIAYPAWPFVSGTTSGMLGWSSRGDIEKSLAEVQASKAVLSDKLAAADMATILKTDELKNYAVSAGAALFKVNCSQCHGSGAQGAYGYPNLNDDSWMWGGKPDEIYKTIAHGIRNTSDPDTRVSEMPAFGGGVLDDAKITQVASYVVQLSGQTPADAAAAQAGQQVFAENCVACHGDKGQGLVEFGAPALNDQIWLFGSTQADIASQVKAPKHGVMPGWSSRLGDAGVKAVAAYVYSLGGGEKVE